MELHLCIFEALIQAIFWYILTDLIIKPLLQNIICDYEWWKRIKSRGAGHGQEASYWTNVSLYPAHATSGIVLILAMINDSNQLFFHGLLIESGYEIFDLCKLWYNYDTDIKLFFVIFNIHHICNISMIIYLCCFMERISTITYTLAISLNGLAPITGMLPMICSALDLNKINHRLIWFVLWNKMIFVFGICRFIIFYFAIYRLIIHEFIDTEFHIDLELLYLISYVLFMTGFNVFIFRILLRRYCLFIQEGICSKQEKEQ